MSENADATNKDADSLNDAEDPLEEEFKESIGKIEHKSCHVPAREKFLITEWITKLKSADKSEQVLRNRFAKYFCSSLDSDANLFSRPPFNTIPINFNGNLQGLRYLIPRQEGETIEPTEDEKRSYIPDLFANLPDKGKFLADQPVPREGTFAILLIVPDAEATKRKNGACGN